MRRKKEAPVGNGRPNGEGSAWLLLAGLALVTLLAGVAAVSCSSPVQEQRAEEPVGDKLKTEEPQARANLEHPSLGERNAPVLMIEYADYQ